jgi:hypothetical protein
LLDPAVPLNGCVVCSDQQREQPDRLLSHEAKRVEVHLAAQPPPMQTGRGEAVGSRQLQDPDRFTCPDDVSWSNQGRHGFVGGPGVTVVDNDDPSPGETTGEGDPAWHGCMHALTHAACQVDAAMSRSEGVRRRREAVHDRRDGSQRPETYRSRIRTRSRGGAAQQYEQESDEWACGPAGAAAVGERGHVLMLWHSGRVGARLRTAVEDESADPSCGRWVARLMPPPRLVAVAGVEYDRGSSPPGLTTHVRRPRRHHLVGSITRGCRASVPILIGWACTRRQDSRHPFVVGTENIMAGAPVRLFARSQGGQRRCAATDQEDTPWQS